MNYNEHVKGNLFQLFYTQKIESHYSAMHQVKGLADIAITNFWHGVADFYGRIHLAGVRDVSYRSPSVTDSYRHFIEEFFPVEWKCKSKLLYEIFRNGMVHQISPKYAAIQYLESPFDELLYPYTDPNNSINPDIPLLNIRVYGELVYKGFHVFMDRVQTNQEPIIYESIHNKITSIPDGLGDNASLQSLIITLGKNPFDSCV